MTITAHPNHLLDQVLSEIETGYAPEAILMLSGMLDASLAKRNGIQCWRRSLIGHPLYQLLISHLHALSIIAAPISGKYSGKEKTDDFPIFAVTKMMASSFSKLGFVRAFAARDALSMQCVGEAWRAGKHVALYDCGTLSELNFLNGRDTTNIVTTPDCSSAREKFGNDGAHPFDLIIANSIADRLSSECLKTACTRFATQLKPGGRIVLSAFAPGHLGQGLQQLCVNPDLVCHTEQTLEEVAQATGLSFSSFRDASNSLIWVEMRAVSESQLQLGEAA